MPSTSAKKIGKVRWISHKEMEAIVEQRAREVLNVSRSTFMKNRKEGKYAQLDADDCPGIVELALLAPNVEVAKLSARKKR